MLVQFEHCERHGSLCNHDDTSTRQQDNMDTGVLIQVICMDTGVLISSNL